MALLNVMVIPGQYYQLDKECINKIARVAPDIRLLDASPMVKAGQDLSPSGNIEFDNMLSEAEVILWFKPPKDVIRRAPKLKWCQALIAGVDHALYEDILKSQVTITNSRGIASVQVSEFTMGLILMCAKRSLFTFQMQLEKKWVKFDPMKLQSKTAGIIGLGSIGKELARMCKSFGMKVMAVRRSIKQPTKAKNVDLLLPAAQLPQLLKDSDFVILTLPFTSETVDLIGENELKSMKSTAFLINVSRGDIVNEKALVNALENGQIAGAALDAFTVEPLPQDSKLWTLPNVIVSSHISGRDINDPVAATDLFCKNLERYIAGKRLINIVGKKKGY